MKKLLLSLMCFPLFAAAAVERVTAEETGRYELGLQFDFIVPNHLPDFDGTQTIWGPKVLVPMDENHIELNFGYGTGNGEKLELKKLMITELAYRWHFEMPYLSGFFQLGGHYTYYSGLDFTHEKIGPSTGLGISFAMAKNFRIALEMKGYLLETLALAFGGNFLISL